MQMILVIIQPTVTFRSEIEIPVPIVRKLHVRRGAEKIEGRRAVERDDPGSVFRRLDTHLPPARLRAGVIVAIIHKRLDFYLNRTAALAPPITHIGRVRALLHPDSFLD